MSNLNKITGTDVVGSRSESTLNSDSVRMTESSSTKRQRENLPLKARLPARDGKSASRRLPAGYNVKSNGGKQTTAVRKLKSDRVLQKK